MITYWAYKNFLKKTKIFTKNKKLKLGYLHLTQYLNVFFKNIKNYRICNLNQKLNLFQKFNVDFVINKKFDKSFSKITCYNFIKNILCKNIKPKYIFVSNNFRFGNKREGNVKLLKSFEKIYQYKIIKPEPLKKKIW